MLDAAEKLSGLGFALHWLQPKSKLPISKNWSSLPVSNFEELKKSFRKSNNMGVRLGEVSVVADLYLHAIDLDIRDASQLKEAHKALYELFPNIATYPCVKSGSGGESRHFYFLSEKPFRSKKLAHSKGKFADEGGHKHWFWEIELFGTGKQTALPPSIHPITGDPYVWLREFDADTLDMGLGPVVPASKVPSAVQGGNADDDDDQSLLDLIRIPPIGLTEDEIRDICFALPTEEWMEDREGWRNVGMAIHHETGASEYGFKIWNDFSKRSTKFEMREQKIAWRSFKDDVANPFTMHSLRKVLKVDGGDFEQCLQKLDLCDKYRQAIQTAAEYDLSPSEIETILPILSKLAADGGLVAKLPAIRKDLAAARKEEHKKAGNRRQKSLEDWVADEVLRVFYGAGAHLKRFNKSYWVYDRGVWRILDSEVVANKVYLTIAKIIKEESDSDGEGALQELLAESGRMDTMNSLTNSVASLIEKKSANDGREDLLGLTKMHVPSIINCKNGELWFDEDDDDYQFIKHKPDHFLTHQIGAEYDPGADCPEWDAALERIFSGHADTEDVIRHLHEIMGYLIQPQRNIAAWIMFFGSGSNGKSFVASVLQEIMSSKAWVGKSLEDFTHSANSHIQAGLVGKLLLVDDDFKKGCMLPDSILKKLSEAKAMTANPKNAGEFNFVCRSTPLILTNSWPKTNDMSYGLERRAEVFHFNTTINEDEKDMGLLRRIVENELPGVLNRLIDGWVALKTRGRLSPPESCKQTKRAWMGKRNALSGFITEGIIITAEKDDFIEATLVWESFQSWSNMDNSGSKWGRNSFYDEIETLPGVTKYMKNGVNWFRGIQLVDLTPDYFDII